MKIIKQTTIIFVLILSLNLSVSAGEFSDAVPFFSNDVMKELTGNAVFSDLIEDIVRGEMPDTDNIIEKLINLVASDVKMCFAYTVTIMGLCILASCIKGSQLNLSGSSGEISYLVCYFLVASFLLGILQKTVNIAVSATDELIAFIKMSLPAYIGIISTWGINVNAARAVFLLMINVISSYAGEFMINSFMYIGILTVVSNMSEQIHISKLIGIFRQVMFWILGFLLTVFAGLTTLSGINASVMSGSGMRAVKYTVGHTIPVVGGFLADATELILSSAKIFKNAFGTGGIIVIFVLCIVPLVKLFLVGFLLKFTAGLSEPFCHKKLCDTVYEVGQTVIYIMVSLILMTVMFILSFAVLLSI